jgi:3-oxoadipate enol-lactonase
MPIATLSNASIHYRLEGPVQAPVILLSNSLGTDMRMWDAQAAALCGEFRLLRYDTRGHGGSSQGAGPCTLDDLGKDLIELFDFLDIGKAHVCGVSLGGMTVLWFALHHPERVCSVMACNTAARACRDRWPGVHRRRHHAAMVHRRFSTKQSGMHRADAEHVL